MARRSLKPQLNQIRSWVRQGRTDAWIAHQLEVSTTELREFRKQHDLTPDEENGGGGEVDLRDEIEAEVEAATSEAEAEAPADEEEGEAEPRRGGGRGDRGRRERGPAPAPASPRSPRWSRQAQGDRGHLRPRRDRRLRALARRLGQGQPRLRRELGRQARGHGQDRPRPDRHPPRRRRRADGDTADEPDGDRRVATGHLPRGARTQGAWRALHASDRGRGCTPRQMASCWPPAKSPALRR